MAFGILSQQQNNMRNTIKITIGIPAHNEENNICRIVASLLDQYENIFEIEKLIVISDGSTDGTVGLVQRIQDERLEVKINEIRQGKVRIMNELFRSCSSDYLVIIDADTIIKDRKFISTFISSAIDKKNIGLVGARVESLIGTSFFERTIAQSHSFKNNMYEINGNNESLYLCHGRARIFSYDFFHTLDIPTDAPEDSYSFLACVRNGYKFMYAPKAVVYFKSPTTLADHMKQSSRFKHGRTALLKYFSKNTLQKEFRLNKSAVIRAAFNMLISHPLQFIYYIIIYLYTLLFGKESDVSHSTWNIAASSKNIT